MRIQPSRPLLAAVAGLLAASLLLYTTAWVVLIQGGALPQVELGFDNDYLPNERAELIRGVTPRSPAEKAGLRRGDRIVAIDGERITDESSQIRAWKKHKPGDQIHLTVRRPGAAEPVSLTGTFRRRPDASTTDRLGRQVNAWFPWPFVAVAIAVLFLRFEDQNAWLLFLLFGGVVVSRRLPMPVPRPGWWAAAMAFEAVWISLLGPIFYWFYARFPTPLFDQRWPRLKWALIAFGLFIAGGALPDGRVRLPPPGQQLLGDAAAERIAVGFVISCLTLGLVAFALNFFRTRDSEARRKMRVMFWGTVVGLGPNLVKLFLQNFSGVRLAPWAESLLTAMLCILPLSFAYAVLVHRVLDIPVLLRRGARYLLVQRGFTIMLSLFSIGLTVLVASATAQASSVALGAVFGTALLWSGTQVHRRVGARIDRAFFRSAYDARVILEDLAESSRAATGRPELASMLEVHLAQALKPSFVKVSFDAGFVEPGAECVVPIQGREGRQLGDLVLGPRLSEEPYSAEDCRLLKSVAGQAATALENMRLAEEIADRMERERRAAREMEIARDVQARLLPQAPPRLHTLECAACCVQARAVGGDYYDFLDLGPDCAGLVLADVAGKGVHAALLVAHLQACLRTQCSMTPRDPVATVCQVNRMLYRSTAAAHYATVFYGIYDDRTRDLAYVNGGHNPPVLLRAGGSVARLEATATVVGAFDCWPASACRTRLDPGDLLVVFSDGVTEAARGDDEFGERRLIESLRARRADPVDRILSGILESVQEFSTGPQSDDLTLLVARAR